MADAVVLHEVTKRFTPEVVGLEDVSFSVPAGQRLVLLGRSGSGKSTLLRHVNRLQRPTGGRIEVLGQDPNRLGGAEIRRLRRRVGMVFQNFHLVGSITALENVCTGMLGSLPGPRMGLWSYPSSCKRKALEQLDRVGLADRAYQRTDTLSGGQQQRVAIARALIQQPAILLADEPVASLDPESSADVLSLLGRISAEDELTVLCSLHQVEIALDFADRIVGLREGRVVFDEETAGVTRDRVMAIYRRADQPAADPAGNLDAVSYA